MKDSEKKHVKDIKIFLKKKKTKGEKRPVKDIKIVIRNKKKSVNIIVNVIKTFLRNKNTASQI